MYWAGSLPTECDGLLKNGMNSGFWKMTRAWANDTRLSQLRHKVLLSEDRP
jgi:hypothetical protein